MDHLKYVITDRNAWAIFNNLQTHQEVGQRLYGKPTSAGFISIKSEKIDGKHGTLITCWGESISLGLESKPFEDAALISKSIN